MTSSYDKRYFSRFKNLDLVFESEDSFDIFKIFEFSQGVFFKNFTVINNLLFIAERASMMSFNLLIFNQLTKSRFLYTSTNHFHRAQGNPQYRCSLMTSLSSPSRKSFVAAEENRKIKSIFASTRLSNPWTTKMRLRSLRCEKSNKKGWGGRRCVRTWMGT